MTYDDKDIDKLVGWARRDALTSYNSALVTEMADMLTQLKVDRAFLRTENQTMREALERRDLTTGERP